MTNDGGFSPFPGSPQSIGKIRVAFERVSPHVRLLPAISTQIKVAGSVVAGLDVEMLIGLQGLVERYRPDVLGDREFTSAWEPPNWRGACFDDDTGNFSDARLDAAYEVMCTDGIPLTWVPRADVIAELISMSGSVARGDLLVTRDKEVIEDCTCVLDQLSDPGGAALAEAVRVAILAYVAGAGAAAQSHCANVFDRLLRDVVGRGFIVTGSNGRFYHDDVRKKLKRKTVSDETLIGEFRASCVLSPAASALKEFLPGRDPVPAEFNRHATAHAAGSTIQFTRANAIVSIMLVTSLLREMQESGW